MSRSKFLACALVVIWLASTSCGGTRGKGKGSQDPPGDQRARLAPNDDELPPKTDDIAATEEEPEFTYCCGNGAYKLEIQCEEGLMRCYEYREGRWQYTYGRHCKRNLGEACYLHGCDDKCQ